MRIGYVLKRYPRYSETFIVAELLAHQAAGLNVEIFVLKQPNEAAVQPAVRRVRFPVEYLTVPSRALDPEARQADDLAQRVKLRGIDLLHAHFATSATSVARRAAAIAGIPYTFTAHAKDIFHRDVDQAALARRIGGAARVVTVSEFNRRHLEALQCTGDTAARPIVRIYNGIDLTEYPLSVAGRNGRVLAVGRLVEKKGFTVLLQALSLLNQQGSPVGCDLVGDGPLAEPLASEAQRLGISGLVRFHGSLPRDTVAEMLRSAGAFVAPCLVSADGDRDGLPTVLIEAMASGAPVITTPVTGIPEIVVPSVTGWLVPEGSVEALGAAIVEVLGNLDRQVAAALVARRVVERNFDLAQNVAELRRVFVAARGSHARFQEVG